MTLFFNSNLLLSSNHLLTNFVVFRDDIEFELEDFEVVNPSENSDSDSYLSNLNEETVNLEYPEDAKSAGWGLTEIYAYIENAGLTRLMQVDSDEELLAEKKYINSGFVVSFKDSVVTIKGITGVKANELLYFDGGASGIALNLEYSIVKALVFGGPNSVRTSELVTRSNRVMSVGVGANLLGRIISPLGKPLDGLGDIAFSSFENIEKKAPGVITRKKISEPIQTGLKVVDSLVPIGRGQRELILGDRKTGKTTIAMDTILTQLQASIELGTPVVCVYVAIGKRMSEIVRLSRMLAEQGSMLYTTIMVARASDPASLQFIAPYAACSMAEYFTYEGRHALIIYDDLSRHADAYRQISLLLRRPVGREAYPGDVFYLHSRLLERAVKLGFKWGAGSLTALPVVETIQGDVSAYIPTNVISITDGQIYLDLNKHQEGLRPAVDPGLSVSRVGSSAQAKFMKLLAGSLKLGLAQFREVEQFSKFGSELDPTTVKLLAKGRIVIELMKQRRNNPMLLHKQLFLLYVSSSTFFEKIIIETPSMSMPHYWTSFFAFVEAVSMILPLKRSVELSLTTSKLLDILIVLHYNNFLHSTTQASLEEKKEVATWTNLDLVSTSVVIVDSVEAGSFDLPSTKE